MPIIDEKKPFKLGKTEKKDGSTVITLPKGHTLENEDSIVMMANSIVIVTRKGMHKKDIERHFNEMMSEIENKDLPKE